MEKSKNTKTDRFKTQYNRITKPSDYTHITGESMTVPNESYSLKEIVEKFSREYPKHMLRTGYFDGEENDIDFDDIDPTRQGDFDLTDAIELKEKIFEKQKTKKAQKNLLTPQNELKTDHIQQTDSQPNTI
ncbi:MAG: hypothetical protein [Microviridae sp.]|nr:MAG: hypothetical protein [Microviridae sp.]